MLPSTGDAKLERVLRLMFMGAGLVFLLNIVLGMGNIVADPDIPRAQILAHLHAGTLGWITFAVITATLWVFAAGRTVSPSYVRAAEFFGLAAFVSFASYPAAFALGFTYGGGFYALLPVFGVASALVIWAAFFFALRQLPNQPVVTTVHVLLAGGLFVGALGATMGVLLGTEYLLDNFWLPAPIDRIGEHAGVMDAYLLLVFAALVEVLVRPDPRAPRRWPGLVQAYSGVGSGLAILVGLLFGILPLAAVSSLLLLVGLVFYVARVGWRSFTVSMRPGTGAYVFWGGLWFVAYVVAFIALIPLFLAGAALPKWTFLVLAHVLFVGGGTNLIFAVASTGARAAWSGLGGLQSLGAWVLNLGLFAFLVGEISADRPDGAWLMAAGVLLGLFTLLVSLVDHAPATKPARARKA